MRRWTCWALGAERVVRSNTTTVGITSSTATICCMALPANKFESTRKAWLAAVLACSLLTKDDAVVTTLLSSYIFIIQTFSVLPSPNNIHRPIPKGNWPTWACLARAAVPFAWRFRNGWSMCARAPRSWPIACAPFTVRDVLSILSSVDVASEPASASTKWSFSNREIFTSGAEYHQQMNPVTAMIHVLILVHCLGKQILRWDSINLAPHGIHPTSALWQTTRWVTFFTAYRY